MLKIFKFHKEKRRSFHDFSQELSSRRAFLLGAGKIILTSSLLGRLYYLQVLESEHYKILSEGNRIRLKLTAPLRGILLDRQGKKLTLNTQNFQLLLNREGSPNPKESIEKIQSLVALYEEDLKRAVKHMKQTPNSIPTPLKQGLTWEEVCVLEGSLSDIPGISVEEGVTREYPHGEILGPILGYIQPISETDTLYKTYLRLPHFKIGRSGLEKMYDTVLSGKPGIRQVEVNARAREVREISHTPAQAGQTIALTLDLELQKFIYTRLSQHKSAAMVVMDAETGDVLAMVSFPSFDPNLLTEGIDSQSWKSLRSNPYGVLLNKAVSGQYAPGSTFKMIVALAGLHSGLLNPKETVFCSGSLALGSHNFGCWARKKGGHGPCSLVNALSGSCDIYFYKMAEKIGPNPIAAMAQRFGLGHITPLNFHNEKPGLIPTTQWKEKKFGTKWTLGETYNFGIGQGYALTTPLQLAQMTARLATGVCVSPRFHNPLQSPFHDPLQNPLHPHESPLPEFPSLNLHPKHLTLVREGMYRVVNGPQGTAMRSMIMDPHFKMAGKTGTSQVVGLGKGYQRQNRSGATLAQEEYKEWLHKDHALFVGYAPHHDPRYALAVVVEHGGGGSSVAAPIAKDVLSYLYERGEG